jgi:monoamine oxidase
LHITLPPPAQEFKLLGGTQQISETLGHPLHILHDRNVVAIEQGASGVTVRAFDSAFALSAYTARRVVVATPPHISAAFQYSPPLAPNKQKLLQHLTQGHMIKTVITYLAPFWRHNGFSGEVVSSSGVTLKTQSLTFTPKSSQPRIMPNPNASLTDPVSICYDDSIPHGASTLAPAIVCFVAGRSGVAASKLSLQQRQQLVLNKLAEYFGPDALQPKQCETSLRQYCMHCSPFDAPAGTSNSTGPKNRLLEAAQWVLPMPPLSLCGVTPSETRTISSALPAPRPQLGGPAT